MRVDYFGEEVAERYDGGSMFSPEVLGPTVDFLAARAVDGAALEFGIGNGRVAVPLMQRGVRVVAQPPVLRHASYARNSLSVACSSVAVAEAFWVGRVIVQTGGAPATGRSSVVSSNPCFM